MNGKKPIKKILGNRLDHGSGVLIFEKDGTQRTSVIFSDIPLKKWQEWNKDCRENFSNIRWAKMMNDHEKSKAFDLLVQEKFDVQLKNQAEEKPKEEILIGGEKLE